MITTTSNNNNNKSFVAVVQQMRMDHDLDEEFVLEDFMCVDEEQDTTNEEPSTSEPSIHHLSRQPEFSSSKEQFNGQASITSSLNPLTSQTRKRFLQHEQVSSRGLSRNDASSCSKQHNYSNNTNNSNNNKKSHRKETHQADFDTYLKRSNQELPECAGGNGAVRSETITSITNQGKRMEKVLLHKQGKVAMKNDGMEELTLEEVDCCDSDEEIFNAKMVDDESARVEIHPRTSDKDQLNNHTAAISASEIERKDLAEKRPSTPFDDDPLWAYDDDWPDLSGEVDEEAVRKAASQPITIENKDISIVTPQLSTDNAKPLANRCNKSSSSTPKTSATSRSPCRIEHSAVNGVHMMMRNESRKPPKQRKHSSSSSPSSSSSTSSDGRESQLISAILISLLFKHLSITKDATEMCVVRLAILQHHLNGTNGTNGTK